MLLLLAGYVKKKKSALPVYGQNICAKKHGHTPAHTSSHTTREVLWEVCDPRTSSADSPCCPTGIVCVVSRDDGGREADVEEAGPPAATLSPLVCLHV